MTTRRKLTASTAALATLAGSLTIVAVSAGTASAGCQPDRDDLKPRYVAGSAKKARIRTGLASSAVQGPGQARYHDVKSAASSVEGSAEAKAEIGKWIAKAEVKAGVKLAKKWSHKEEWEYVLYIDRGKTQRIRMWHLAKKQTITKYIWDVAHCSKTKVKWKHTMITPMKGNSNNVWLRENA
ncbi:hypothetical protein ACGFT2_15255 [Streptomyces sp. NPDC048514]|uniref:hypothetical protein n=1 Tax=Streptomyces sp. NPDC048514 TaxID=3365564 RepID=UPI003712C1C4